MMTPEQTEKMRKLRARYLATLAEQVAELRVILAQTTLDAEAVQRLRFLTHSIGGSAIVFDLETLGERALAAEATILQAAGAPRALHPEERAAFDAAFATFEEEYRAAVTP